MTTSEVAGFIRSYAQRLSAPILTDTTVTSVRPVGEGYRLVVTDGGAWRCRALVIASGACSQPVIPSLAKDLPATVATLSAREYRRPELLPEGARWSWGPPRRGCNWPTRFSAPVVR